MKIRTKILGASTIILALVIAFQAASYYLTNEGINKLEEMRCGINEYKLALEVKHLFVHKALALSYYALFPREDSLWQIRYADKAFRKKLEEMDRRLHGCGSPGRLDMVKSITGHDDVHNRQVEAFAAAYRKEGADRAIRKWLKPVEAEEEAVLAECDNLEKETMNTINEAGSAVYLHKRIGFLFPSVQPVFEARDKILASIKILWTYIDLDDLGHQETIASRWFVLTGDERYISIHNDSKTAFDREVARHVSSDGETYRRALTDAKGFSDSISVAVGDAVGAYRAGDAEGAKAFMLGSFVNEEMLASTLADMYSQKISEFDAAYASLPSIVKYSLYFNRQLLVIITIVAVLVFVTGSFMIKRMIWPIKMLNEAAGKIAGGDWGQRVVVRTHDEIGEMADSFNKMTSDLEKAQKELLEWNMDLSVLYSVSSAISRTIELDKLLADVLDAITTLEIFKVERKGGVFIVEGDNMRLVSHLGHPDAFLDLHKDMKVGTCLCGKAAVTGEIIISMNSTEDERHEIRPPGMHEHGHIIVPLKAKDKVVGVLYLYMPPGIEIDKDKVNVLRAIGNQVGVAIENAKLYEETRALSLHDPLTGLANRRLMDILLERKFALAKRVETPFSVIMLDIDFFKRYNDTYGHPAGDLALAEVAGIILREVRDIDLVVRYGGEEFFVLLSDTKPQDAHVVAERIREAVKAGTAVTVSLGIAAYEHGIRNGEDLVKRADEALYQAKQEGRDRVCVSG